MYVLWHGVTAVRDAQKQADVSCTRPVVSAESLVHIRVKPKDKLFIHCIYVSQVTSAAL
jgi:hypothetical protein